MLTDVVDDHPPVRDEAALRALVAAVGPGLEARRARRGRRRAGGARPLAHRRPGARRAAPRWRCCPRSPTCAPSWPGWSTDGFVGEAGARRLRRYPTYLRALERASRAARRRRAAVGRDRQLLAQLRRLQEAWLHRVAALPEGRPPGAALREARWLLEEYRVSLWAQQLGIDGKVSDARIRKVLDRAS